MKIDISNFSDFTQWDFRVFLVVMLLTQAFAFCLWIRRDMKRCNSPVEQQRVRGRHFGGV